MSERPTEFVVQRSKWLRGDNDSLLLQSSTAKMCCLGFVAEQCGVSSQARCDVGAPESMCDDPQVSTVEFMRVDGLLVRFDPGRGWRDTAMTTRAININDDPSITDAEREAQLTALFAEHGYTLRFEP